MKTIKVTTDNKISIIDVDFDNFRSIQAAVGGHFETVKTQRMFEYFGFPIIFIGDEESHIKGLPLNMFGSWLYATDTHGWPIAGDIILAIPFGEYIWGLENPEEIKEQLLQDFTYLEEEINE